MTWRKRGAHAKCVQATSGTALLAQASDDHANNKRKSSERREDDGITRDQRGQVQPKDKDTARRA
jgi:hypothetical protein